MRVGKETVKLLFHTPAHALLELPHPVKRAHASGAYNCRAAIPSCAARVRLSQAIGSLVFIFNFYFLLIFKQIAGISNRVVPLHSGRADPSWPNQVRTNLGLRSNFSSCLTKPIFVSPHPNSPVWLDPVTQLVQIIVGSDLIHGRVFERFMGRVKCNSNGSELNWAQLLI